MSLHTAAQHLASKGRGDDKMLIHMTPQEVGGLQALALAHGGSLTINPDTGLPEAGFLKKLLPTLIGAGLTFMSGGALNPATIGMITGGVETLRTGDLGKGIMAGLGAYGGAGIGASFAGGVASATPSVGAQAAGTQAMTGEVAKQAAQDAALNFGADGISQAATNLPGPVMGTEAGARAITDAYRTGVADFAAQDVGAQIKGSAAAINQPGGAGNFGSNIVSQFGSPTKTAMGAFGVAAPFIPQPQMPTMPGPEPSNYAGPYKPTDRQVRFKQPGDTSTSEFAYFSPSNPIPGFEPLRIAAGGQIDPDYDMQTGAISSFSDSYAEGGQTEDRGPIRMPGADYVPGTSPEFNYGFKPVQTVNPAGMPITADLSGIGNAGSGFLGSLVNQVMNRPITDETFTPTADTKYKYDPSTQSLVVTSPPPPPPITSLVEPLSMFNGDGAARGGMMPNDLRSTGLTALAGGRFLQGPGDGTSDSIPAVIGDRQPARLADGEFVVDARTVSELGNGSSKAGAQKLYKMMNRVHAARKKAGRGKDSNAEQYLPA